MSSPLVVTDSEFEELVRDRELDQAEHTPELMAALAAAAAPLLRVVVTRADHNAVRRHRLWLAEDAVAILAAVEGGRSHLIVSAPQFLAADIARLVRLGPRLAEPYEFPPRLPIGSLDELVDQAPWSMNADVVGEDSVWILNVDWADGELITVMYDRADGLWEMRPVADSYVGQFRSPTEVWRAISDLLLVVDPGDAVK